LSSLLEITSLFLVLLFSSVLVSSPFERRIRQYASGGAAFEKIKVGKATRARGANGILLFVFRFSFLFGPIGLLFGSVGLSDVLLRTLILTFLPGQRSEVVIRAKNEVDGKAASNGNNKRQSVARHANDHKHNDQTTKNKWKAATSVLLRRGRRLLCGGRFRRPRRARSGRRKGHHGRAAVQRLAA